MHFFVGILPLKKKKFGVARKCRKPIFKSGVGSRRERGVGVVWCGVLDVYCSVVCVVWSRCVVRVVFYVWCGVGVI